jgi:hypothetical protein
MAVVSSFTTSSGDQFRLCGEWRTDLISTALYISLLHIVFVASFLSWDLFVVATVAFERNRFPWVYWVLTVESNISLLGIDIQVFFLLLFYNSIDSKLFWYLKEKLIWEVQLLSLGIVEDQKKKVMRLKKRESLSCSRCCTVEMKT